MSDPVEILSEDDAVAMCMTAMGFGSTNYWTMFVRAAKDHGLALVKIESPPVTERERLVKALDAWFLEDAERCTPEDQSELPMSYESSPLTYGDLRSIRALLAEDDA
jgi:hypothetical protein